MELRQLHLWVGGLAILLFILTGQYMARMANVPELADMDRLLYRSNHIYLLLVAIINVAVGSYMPGKPDLKPVQRICSYLLLSLPVLLAYSFFAEPQTGDIERPITQASLFLAFGIAALLITWELFQYLRGRRQ